MNICIYIDKITLCITITYQCSSQIQQENLRQQAWWLLENLPGDEIFDDAYKTKKMLSKIRPYIYTLAEFAIMKNSLK